MSREKKALPLPDRTIPRRAFLAGAAAATAPLILPSGVLAQRGRPGANDRLVLGHIGAGGQGRSHLKFLTGRKDVQVAAICDVDARRHTVISILQQRRSLRPDDLS